MKFYRTEETWPLCVADSEVGEEVWWWSAEFDGWMLGDPLLMDFRSNWESTCEKYPFWAPRNQITVPDEVCNEG